MTRAASAAPRLSRKTATRMLAASRFFFSNEGSEPVHVHVEAGDAYAKLWLEPVAFAEVRRFNAKQMRQIREIVRDRRTEILEAWNEHFRTQD